MKKRLKSLGLLCAGCLSAGSLFASWPVDSIGLSITTANPAYVVPPTFVGVAFENAYISGDGTTEALFDSDSHDPKYNPFYNDLQNLVSQIGMTHIRLLQSGAVTGSPDPLGPQIDNFYTFAGGAGVQKVIYSLHLYNEDEGVSGTDNGTSAAHVWTTTTLSGVVEKNLTESFAFDNEPDWKFHYDHPEGSTSNSDPVITGYDSPTSSTGYKGKWEKLRGEVNTAIGATASFSGPDTGSNYPVETTPASNNTEPVSGVPWTVKFVNDEFTLHSNITTATQHYYHEQGDMLASNWIAPGDPGYPAHYFVGDVVIDQQDPINPGAYYTCKVEDPSSNTHPYAASGYWRYSGSKGMWASGNDYAVDDTVQDPQDGYTAFVCIVAVNNDGNHPSSTAGATYWAAIPDNGFVTANPEYLSANQLAVGLLNPARVTEWGSLYSNVLAGETISGYTWPSGLPFRLTESSPYLGGLNPANMSFATALWGLDYFHYWARHGCVGIDPFNRVAQTNAPIYQLASGDFAATPYAYGMKAFLLGASGQTINASNFMISGTANLSAYGVVSSDGHHLYVTIINKTFVSGGPISAASAVLNVDIKPTDFAATSAHYVELVSTGGYGDISAQSATLGGATIPTSGTFSPTWLGTGVSPCELTSKGGGEYTIQVQPSEAVVVDLQK